MKLLIVPLAAAAIALTAAPALAKSKKHRTHHHPHYGQSYHPGAHAGYRGGWYGGGYGPGFVGRNVSDPSFVSPGYVRNQAYGRCVEDLGYGRYEYCGW